MLTVRLVLLGRLRLWLLVGLFFLLTVFLTFLFIGLEYAIHPISSKIDAPTNTYNPEPEAFIFVSNKLADLLRQKATPAIMESIEQMIPIALIMRHLISETQNG